MKNLLDEHFQPMLDESWLETLSIYEIGCRPHEGVLREIIVWMRSVDIVAHIKGLLIPAAPEMIADPVDRSDGGGEACRLKGDTVFVRLLKRVETEAEGKSDLMIELFQVFATEAEAEQTYQDCLRATQLDTPPS
jgi:hypothetical protein